MNTSQILKEAEEMGIELGWIAKADLIRSIQRAEGNIDCYAKERNKEGCPWRDECLKAENEIAQIEATLRGSSFITRDLRNSACILSLIVENPAKFIKDELFLKHSFEAITDEVKRMKKLISFVKSITDQNGVRAFTRNYKREGGIKG